MSISDEERALIIKKASENPPPPEVLARFKALCDSDTHVLSCFLPKGGRNVYYVVFCSTDQVAMPVAIIPVVPPHEMLMVFEDLLMRFGSKEHDPEFKGSVQ